MRRLILIIVLLPLFAIPIQSTLACSGGSNSEIEYSIEYMLDWSDYFVKARVIAADSANQNFILDIISSQKAMPPRQLVLSVTPPFSIRGSKNFGARNGCSFGGRVRGVRVGDVGYFPLQRNEDGSYSTYLSLGYGLWHSEFNDQTVAYTRINPLGEETIANMNAVPVPTEEAYVQLVEAKGGTAPVPNTTQLSEFIGLPPTAPILLTTDTGKQYMLPMDGQGVVLLDDKWLARQFRDAVDHCFGKDCMILSPDTSIQLIRKSSDTLIFQTGYGQCYYYAWACTPIDGQTGLFSTTNDTLAVWNEDKLDIYQWSYEQNEEGSFPIPHKLTTIPLNITAAIRPETLQGRAVWSNDGNSLVFADAVGLWMIDLYQGLTPQRMITGRNSQAILPISLTGNGRFLAYSLDGNRANWLLRDLQSGAEYHNLILSPDGRYGLALNTVNAGGANTSLLTIFAGIFPAGGTWDVQWLNGSDRHYIKTCGSQVGTCRVQFCGISVINLPPNPQPYFCWSEFMESPLNDADYDINLGLVYVSSDGQTVYTQDRLGYKWQPFVDGKIIDVEWMLPRFYYEYQHP